MYWKRFLKKIRSNILFLSNLLKDRSYVIMTYMTKSGERIYNPRSVVLALTNNNLGNYWTSSGPYDEIFSAMTRKQKNIVVK